MSFDSMFADWAAFPGRTSTGWTSSLGVTLLLMATAGCLTVRYSEGTPLPAGRVQQIRAGETTKAELLQWFGAPQGFSDSSVLEALVRDQELLPEEVLDLPFADVLVFRYSEGELRAKLFVVYVRADVRVVADTLVVFFDENDRVLYYGLQEGTRAFDSFDD